MQFNVGPFVYTVRISPATIHDERGRELLGLAVLEDQEILLSPRIRPEMRLNILLHELAHAWEFHFPAPKDEEERAMMQATVTAAAIRDMKKQGGDVRLRAMVPAPVLPAGDRVLVPVGAAEECEEASEDAAHAIRVGDKGDEGPRYVPLDVVESWQTNARPSAGRSQCGVCDTVVQDGMVENDPPAWNWNAGGLVMKRRFFCPHCGDLQEWTEGAKATGVPTGAVISGPDRITDPVKVEQFLSKFPAATGLMVE